LRACGTRRTNLYPAGFNPFHNPSCALRGRGLQGGWDLSPPRQIERYDYEYRRNGTFNLFVVLDVHRPWRKVKVTERRAAEDYAGGNGLRESSRGPRALDAEVAGRCDGQAHRTQEPVA